MWYFVITVLATNTIAVQNSKALHTISTEAFNSRIADYEQQSKENKFQIQNKRQEYAEFDIENSRNGMFHRLPDRFAVNVDNNLIKENGIINKYQDDEMLTAELNTLENSIRSKDQIDFEQNKSSWLRVKKSIPVLEPVKHLLDRARSGNLNHTFRGQSNRHHHILSEGEMNNEENNNDTAIETEEEREMINEGPDLQILEFLGSIGSKIWDFFSNLRQLFAASSGSASASLSSSAGS
ncbi:uncharacterized protein ACN427_009709 [Glossina fuscipes fuscipes]